MPGFINNSPFQQIKQLEAGNNPFKGTQKQNSKKVRFNWKEKSKT